MNAAEQRLAEPFVLPPDVQLVAVAELDDALRARIAAGEGAYALARPKARAPAKLVDAATATLLRQFAGPRTIVDAVIAAGELLGEAPEQLLDAAYPLLKRLIDGGLLVSVSDMDSARLAARYQPGDLVCGCIVQSVLHLLQDTELYLARDSSGSHVVLKLARVEQERTLGDFAREARVLARLDGRVAPRLLETGQLDQRPYLMMEWCPGINAERIALDIRQSHGAGLGPALGRLACAIADAYTALHAGGIVHGDVHEGNMLVDRDGRVRIVDFGHALILDEAVPRRGERGGWGLYFEPEYARAWLGRMPSPDPTPASDQYSLAAMCYYLLTDANHIAFALEEDRVFRQIAESPIAPFADRGAEPWPAVEAVLARGLDKHPERRFPSMGDFALALRNAVEQPSQSAAPQAPIAGDSEAGAALDRLLASVDWDGDLLQSGIGTTPTASCMYGAAGVAYALYRLAMLRHQPRLLSVADLWAQRAVTESRKHRGFFDGDLLTPESVGWATLHHGSTGVIVVRALLAHAMGDFVTLGDCLRALERLPAGVQDDLDFSLGLPGVLAGLSLVLEALPESEFTRPAPLLRAGRRCAGRVTAALEALPSIHQEEAFVNLGIAHGWAGALYALMRWHQASGDPLPGFLAARTAELAALREPSGRGVRWPWRSLRSDDSPVSGYMSGWCNGSAGFVHFWLLAHELFRDGAWLELAEAAAWDAWEDAEGIGADLCCGLAGRAYALLALHRVTGVDEWLHRADSLCRGAIELVREEGELSPILYKGALGVLLLREELQHPWLARMPLFEREGWPMPSPSLQPRRRP